ncbi:uncharacterized protein LOC142615988 [Castanea sativa]|uniref:uncharacterized protein LOC142615988 n=1 Tax=Castanea sativa TaxID=21020 RepID=UPI003F64DA3B
MEDNMEADVLAKTTFADEMIDRVSNWTTPIVSYLKDKLLPDDTEEARKLNVRATRTTVRTPTGKTPFKLAYGSDAVIPAKVGLTSYRVTHYNNEENEKQLRLSHDLIDKVRMDAEQRVSRYKNLMIKHHDSFVKPRQYNVGDLVLERVSLATKDPTHGKLGPNWEGPYRVINSERQGLYYLEALDG